MNPLALAAAGVWFAGAALACEGEFFVTCHLDPNGDNRVALTAAPNLGAKRLMKLGPGTCLLSRSPDPAGNWREVVVQPDLQSCSCSGPQGWVHTACICRVEF